MKLPITPISKEDFLKFNYIFFSNITVGFALYNSVKVTPKTQNNVETSTKYFSEFLSNEFSKSSFPVFVDFYINNITDEELQNLRRLLPSNYKSILDSLTTLRECDTVFFEITDSSIIPFFTYLSAKELFFTTFYFKDFTLWGNYNLTFPLFYRDESYFNSLLLPNTLTYK